MGAQTGHLVGRAEELGSLDRVRAELDRGRSVAVLLVGEAGIGKTRLLTEFGARADAEGDLVLSGAASELERDLPFSLFVDALDEYVRGVDPELIAPARRAQEIPRRRERFHARHVKILLFKKLQQVRDGLAKLAPELGERLDELAPRLVPGLRPVHRGEQGGDGSRERQPIARGRRPEPHGQLTEARVLRSRCELAELLPHRIGAELPSADWFWIQASNSVHPRGATVGP